MIRSSHPLPPPPPPPSSTTCVWWNLSDVLARHSLAIGLILRWVVAWLLPRFMDDTAVPYTDIDYYVFTDAAEYVRQGASPYQRTTYRYTPLLAVLLAQLPYFRTTARYVFCLADAVCGWLIQRLLQRQQQGKRNTENISLQDALWWLYNPLAINICTRGSAESIQVLLPVLVTVWLIQQHRLRNMGDNRNSKTSNNLILPLIAGICHGVAVHAKLYPIIYSLSYVISLMPQQQQQQQRQQSLPPKLWIWWLWLKDVVRSQAVWMFGVSAAVTFGASTALGVYWYGPTALQEGLLYHFSRIDHRHNYSMHWYWIYLARAAAADSSTTINARFFLAWAGRLLLAPQLVLLIYTSFTLAPIDVTYALFVQTFVFVSHNKVITAQYFTWYLCLLPLCCNYFQPLPQVLRAVVGLVLAMITWLASAYFLELQGWGVHRYVWLASLLFYFAQVNLLTSLLQSSVPASALSSTVRKKQKQTDGNSGRVAALSPLSSQLLLSKPNQKKNE